MLWWLLGAVILAALALEVRTHLWLPALAQALRCKGEQEQARTVLEEVIDAPSLLPGGSKLDARFQLAWMDMEQGRFPEAAEHCRRILEQRVRPAFGVLVRYRLADCLDAAGDAAGARRERDQAVEALRDAPNDAGVHTARGWDLVRRGRAAEACTEYEAALARLPHWNAHGRAEVLVWLALAHHQAGQPEEATRRAEEAIALHPGPELVMTARSVAALGYASRRMLDEAEAHRLAAFTLAEETGNEDRAGNYLASLAGTQRARGKLVEAMQTAEKAGFTSFKSRRHARVVEAECLWAMGRLDAARTCLEQARAALPHPQPAEECRSQATLALAQGMLEADAGNPELGLKLLQEAAPELRRDPRLTLWHDAAMAPVLAALGREDETRALIASIEEHAAAFEADVATQERCWAGIGRALLTLNDPAGARSAWLRFLAGPPEPVDRPEGYYQMGECERLLGNGDAAWQAYRSAGSLGIETRYARRARQRMKDEGAAVIAPGERRDEGTPPAPGEESPVARETT